jgi:hypothetical protein
MEYNLSEGSENISILQKRYPNIEYAVLSYLLGVKQ